MADQDQELPVGDVEVERVDRGPLGARVDATCLVVGDGSHRVSLSQRDEADRLSGLGMDHDLDRLLVTSAGRQSLFRLVEPVGTGDQPIEIDLRQMDRSKPQQTRGVAPMNEEEPANLGAEAERGGISGGLGGCRQGHQRAGE
jgi:hypothetical protein